MYGAACECGAFEKATFSMPGLAQKTSKSRSLNYGPILAAMPRPAAVLDTRGDDPSFMGFSSAFLAELGLKASAVRGRLLREVFPHETYLLISDAVRRCQRRAKAASASITYRSGTSALRRDVVASPIREGAGGQILLTIEPARRDMFSKERRTLLDRLGPLNIGMVYVYDLAAHRTRYVQRELLDLLGIPPAGIEFEAIRARTHPEDVPRFISHLAELSAMNDDEVSEATLRMRTPDGRWLPMRSRARVFARDAAGSVRKVIGTATDVSEQFALSQALEAAAQALAVAETVERRRVGRELHDSTVQHLVAMDLSLTALERRISLHLEGSSALHDTRTALSAAQREIRTFSFMLHPPELEERGLDDTLRAFADGFARRTGLYISVDVEGACQPLSFDLELALFRVAQEALMNVHRHARARSVGVRLCYGDQQVTLQIEDDGAGLPDPPMRPAGVGISGMRARMAQLDGKLSLEPGLVGLRVVALAPARIAAPARSGISGVVDVLRSGPMQGAA